VTGADSDNIPTGLMLHAVQAGVTVYNHHVSHRTWTYTHIALPFGGFDFPGNQAWGFINKNDKSPIRLLIK